MKSMILRLLTAATISSITSCGIPTALMRTYKNSVEEITELSNGTSSAYQDIR